MGKEMTEAKFWQSLARAATAANSSITLYQLMQLLLVFANREETRTRVFLKCHRFVREWVYEGWTEGVGVRAGKFEKKQIYIDEGIANNRG